jgi:hypothetical protein
MSSNHRFQRPMAVALAGVMVLGAVTPAFAGRGHGKERRYKGPRVVETRVVQPAWRPPVRRVVVRESGAAPVVAGILGGLILGAAISHAADVHADYTYWDPYCREHFVSLHTYRGHLHRHHHPRVVRVINTRTGACDFSYRWERGDWRRWDGHGRVDCCDRTSCRERGHWRHEYDDHGWDDRYDGRDDDRHDDRYEDRDDRDWDR